MTLNIRLGAYEFPVEAEQAETKGGVALLHGKRVTIDLPFAPLRYYRHGWQSWSLTMWQGADQRIPESQPALLQPMQVDPLYAGESRPNGSWVGAVEAADGQVLLLGALGLEAHVRLNGNRLKGWSEADSVEWLVALGSESETFGSYASRLETAFGKGRVKNALRVWCSWYSLYTAISEKVLLGILDELGDLPFDVFQVDDGWQIGIGDWEPNEKFPSGMAALAGHIRESGRRPGLWLAPLLVAPSSSLFRQHPDWLLRDGQGQLVSAGFNWGEPMYALDTTHPAALDWLVELMKKVRTWGYDYAKLDFLYAGALPGVRHNGMPRETAYRHGLQAIREALGEAYFLTCGAPVLPSIGLCDGMRVGPDVAGEWDNPRDSRMLTNYTTPGARNAIRTTLNRLWLAPLLHTDPDVAYFRSKRISLTAEQKRLLQDLALVCGFKATSDLPAWLTAAEKSDLLAFLQAEPLIERGGRNTFHSDGREVDFSPAMPLPDPQPVQGAVVSWAANRKFVMRLFDQLGKQDLKKMIREEFGSEQF
jgi:alpha-galactosidase